MALEAEFRKAKAPRIVYKGREIWLHHQFPIANGQRVQVTIESFDSDWGGLGERLCRQGVGLMVDKRLEIEGMRCRLLTIWPYSPPVEELRPPPFVEQLGLRPAQELQRVRCGSIHAEAGIKTRLCLWLDQPLHPVEVVGRTRDGHIHVWNVWNFAHWSKGVDGQHNGAGMIVEEIENGFRYYCNDGYPDEDFNDIVFRIERCEE